MRLLGCGADFVMLLGIWCHGTFNGGGEKAGSDGHRSLSAGGLWRISQGGGYALYDYLNDETSVRPWNKSKRKCKRNPNALHLDT